MAFFKITPTTQVKKGAGFIARVRCKTTGYDKSKFFKAKVDAENYAIELKKSLNLNLSLGTTNKSNIIYSNFNHELKLTPYSPISAFIEAFLQYTEKNPISVSSTGRHALELITKYNISNVLCCQITYNDLVDYCQERLQTCQAQTVRIDISLLSRAIMEMSNKYEFKNFKNPIEPHYAQLKKTGHIADSKTRTRRLKKGEFRKLYRECYKYQNKSKVMTSYTTFFCLSILSCLRCTELAALKWSDIDFENNLMYIRTGKNTLPGTNGRNENHVHIAMQPAIHNLLKKLKKRTKRPSEFIFPITSKSFSSTFPTLISKAGLDDLRLHDMKREGISLLLEQGLTPVQVAVITGHRDLSMITEIYNAINTNNIISQLNPTIKKGRSAA